jgi:hypothetical protein
MTSGLVHEASKSGTVEWYTPEWLFQLLGVTFDTDVASPGPAVVPWVPARRHITVEENGLIAPWTGRVWMNHPYGIQDMTWVERFLAHGNGIGICHARPDNAWCKRLMRTCDGVSFVKRIKFVDATGKVPLAKNKKGKWVKLGPGCGQMLFAIGGGHNWSNVVKAVEDERLTGQNMVARW